ncbi:MAG: hypothetical protein KAX38_01235 [Candidatus Krumholzibacteria bacterium]|nr:hypothetical protein [Candidatus Krumholzibacteria bacterium]
MVKTGIAGMEILEEKINKAAELIERMRRDKNDIEKVNKELKERVELLYIRSEELNKELEVLKRKKVKNTDLDKSREEIKNKIEEMLAKLEAIHL